jgi:hypothetical protein
MLVSEGAVELLHDRSAYSLRRIDDARREAPAGGAPVYEVLDALSEAERAGKLAARGESVP